MMQISKDKLKQGPEMKRKMNMDKKNMMEKRKSILQMMKVVKIQ